MPPPPGLRALLACGLLVGSAAAARAGSTRLQPCPAIAGSTRLEPRPAVELSAQMLAEAWNYNRSREELYGGEITLTHPVRDRLVLTFGPAVYYTSQRGADAYMMALAGGARWRFARRERSSAFAGVSIGVSRAEHAIPPGGTRFNYVFRLDAGVTRRVGPELWVLAGMTWMHLSNNSLAGRDRNPDIQAVGLRIGMAVPW